MLKREILFVILIFNLVPTIFSQKGVTYDFFNCPGYANDQYVIQNISLDPQIPRVGTTTRITVNAVVKRPMTISKGVVIISFLGADIFDITVPVDRHYYENEEVVEVRHIPKYALPGKFGVKLWTFDINGKIVNCLTGWYKTRAFSDKEMLTF